MSRNSRCWWVVRSSYITVVMTVFGLVCVPLVAQDAAPAPTPRSPAPPSLPPVTEPAPLSGNPALPINLPTALRLANAQPIDIGVASQRLQAAAAQLDRAKVLWLPTVVVGPDYYRHDGQIQNTDGTIINVSKSSFMFGAGPVAVFALSDAIFAPLAARQEVRAREAGLQAVTNDTVLAVAEAYFNVQQARGELAGAEDAAARAAELARRVQEMAKQLVPAAESARARAELAERQQDVQTARERWLVASAELARVLRLDPSAPLKPVEPSFLRITLVPAGQAVDDLIPIALQSRPELSAQQALVQATLQRLRQERLRPLVPSILLRGASSGIFGTLGGGVFGGGTNSSIGSYGGRSDIDLQVLWEFQNLGFGNAARVRERRAENQQAILEFFRTQDRVAAEVVQALTQVQSAAARFEQGERGLKDAIESANTNFEGMSQTKQAGNLVVLVIRPQEAVAAIQALYRAYGRFFLAAADYNRAQFRLYRALGNPAQCLAEQVSPAASNNDRPVVPEGGSGTSFERGATQTSNQGGQQR